MRPDHADERVDVDLTIDTGNVMSLDAVGPEKRDGAGDARVNAEDGAGHR